LVLKLGLQEREKGSEKGDEEGKIESQVVDYSVGERVMVTRRWRARWL
jgi:hypothetical protein